MGDGEIDWERIERRRNKRGDREVEIGIIYIHGEGGSTAVLTRLASLSNEPLSPLAGEYLCVSRTKKKKRIGKETKQVRKQVGYEERRSSLEVTKK